MLVRQANGNGPRTMKATSLSCPSCGAPVEDLHRKTNLCEHCGRSFVISGRDKPGRRKRSERPPTAPTVGTLVWQRLRPHTRLLFQLLAVLLTLGAASQILTFFTFSKGRGFADKSILSAILIGVSALLLASTGRKVSGMLLSILGGLVLMSKPFLFPIWSDFMGERRLFRLNTETHLNFLIPGILLFALGLLLSLTLHRRTEAQED